MFHFLLIILTNYVLFYKNNTLNYFTKDIEEFKI